MSDKTAQPTVEGWHDLIGELEALPSRLLARLPRAMQEDSQLRQEVGRLALASLAAGALEMLSFGPDHPFFIPQLNALLFAGQPNPDTFYKFTSITPGGTYRLRGKRGTMRIATIGQMGPRPQIDDADEAGAIKLYHDLNALSLDAAGNYDVIFSPERPPDHQGDWWQLAPGTNRLLLRLVSYDWGNEMEPTVAIERLDGLANRPRPSAAVMEERLRALPREVNFMAGLFVTNVENLRQQGYCNKLRELDVSGIGGLVGQFYYEGAYELEDHEALLIEVSEPKCHYRSIMLTNEMYDTLDWYNNQSCLNGTQAAKDPDGILRIVVSSRDPGVPNWLDTAGHRRGLIQGRWMSADSGPIPNVRRILFDQLRSNLHPDTPQVTVQERDAMIRERRAAMQHRTLW